MSEKQNGFMGAYTEWIFHFRWPVIVVSILAIAMLSTGARHLKLNQNYRVFFGENDPHLIAFDDLEDVYVQMDNSVFMVHNPDGTIFNADAFAAVRTLSDAGWQIPNSTRVDSITNYQHTRAEGDDLIVEDLVPADAELNEALIARVRDIALNDPILLGNVVSRDEATTLVVVQILLSEDDPGATVDTAEASHALLEDIRRAHPDLRFELTGVALLASAFGEAPLEAARTVFPAMFLLLIVFIFLFTRSISGTIATWAVIALSAAGAMGAAGFYGYGINPANIAAPVVVLTLAIADSVHILLSMFKEMEKGVDKRNAIAESLRINAQPVFLTSLTTAIGFLVMNFSDAPPFHQLGNITATGVGIAWILSVSFLPAMLFVLPIRRRRASNRSDKALLAIANFNIAHRWPISLVLSAVVIALALSITRMKLDDTPHQYFAKSIDFRTATDFFDEKVGFYGYHMSLLAEESGGINSPEYLDTLDRFTGWLEAQPNVAYVSSYSKIAKKLNQNMHGDDPAYYRVPQERELAAQYLLLYEMSLPYGLDLNNQINVDKSGTRVSVTFRKTALTGIANAGLAAEDWLRENGVGIEVTPASGPPVMFSHISKSNISSMFKGTLVGFTLIAIVLVFSLRSVSIGLLSLVPNIVPAACAFGIWALVVGEAGFAISIVAGLSIGIIVDDTVHFLSKYSRARNEMGLDTEEAVRYSFATVGQALLSTSFIVSAGFAVLSLSTFRVTAMMGSITSLTVVCALIADFLLLPSLLLLLDRRQITVKELEPVLEQA